MRRRPAWFVFLAVIFAGIAIALPLQVMWIYGHGVSEAGAVFSKLTFLNWLVIGGSLACSALLWQASPKLRYAIPALIVAVTLNNFFVGYYATDFSVWTASYATLAFALINLPLLHPQLQWILLHPDRRWWMRSERRRLHLPITIEGTRLQSSKAETFDISETGAFVNSVRDVGVGDWITVRMKFGTLTQIRCQARVVRRCDSQGIYPAGMGVQFMNMSWKERRELRRCLDRGATL